MNLFKPHFWYHKRQRNGVLFLVSIILILQFVYFYVDFSSDKIINTNSSEISYFQKQIDSLKIIALEKRKPKIYPFNPNYITDFKGGKLGMTIQEIDRLHNYRKQHKFVNSVQEFQQITKVSDSLLKKIAPYFKFPDWVIKQNKLLKNNSKHLFKNQNKETFLSSKKNVLTTTDLNKATQQDFETIDGVGEVISERIIKYRNKLQGFSYKSQLYEVWGVNKPITNRILKVFKIYMKPKIKKININTITFKGLLKVPYIDYELCKSIFEYRDEVAELQNISEIKNIANFPIDKYDRIALYLKAE